MPPPATVLDPDKRAAAYRWFMGGTSAPPPLVDGGSGEAGAGAHHAEPRRTPRAQGGGGEQGGNDQGLGSHGGWREEGEPQFPEGGSGGAPAASAGLADDAAADGSLATRANEGYALTKCERFLVDYARRGASAARGAAQRGEAALVATCRDALGRTMLALAALRGDLDGASAALAHGADVHEGDAHGVAPLALAAWRGHHRMVDFLLEHAQADPSRVDAFGVTALHRAVGHRRLHATARLLGAAGVDASARTLPATVPESYGARSLGQTPLHIARGDAALTRLLLRYRAAPAAVDDRGDTPLHLAAEQGALEACRLLLKAGADADAANRDGKRPADMLPDHASKTLADVLLAAEASSRARKRAEQARAAG